MKSYKFLILTCLTIFIIFSCKKANDDTKLKSFPVEWLLSNQDKNIFNAFSNNMQIQYSDAGNNILVFQADSIYTKLTYPENNLDKGEALSIKYNCLSSYFPNYSYVCQLSARPDQSVDLYITFGTGTHWNDHHNDYVLSSFLFNPNDPSDSLSGFGYQMHQTYLDSILLRDTVFYDVFLDSNLVINIDPEQTTKCYYTVQNGIVAFENLDGKFGSENKF